jgi:uncharacterized protein
MLIRKTLWIFLALSVLSVPARADELTRDKRADIERILEMTGALSLGKQMARAAVTNLAQILKKARPDIPQNVLDLLPAEVEAVFDENFDSFKEAVIPIYHKYFTAAELKEMIRFYSTDLGQKTIKVMPSLMQEGMAAGQRWGQSLGPQINRRVSEKLKQQGIRI